MTVPLTEGRTREGYLPSIIAHTHKHMRLKQGNKQTDHPEITHMSRYLAIRLYMASIAFFSYVPMCMGVEEEGQVVAIRAIISPSQAHKTQWRPIYHL